MFRDQFKRPDTDDAWPEAKVYRFLARAQHEEVAALAALFPRLNMGAPHQWTSADGGLTYQSTILDTDGRPITPFGHAEAYVRSAGGYDGQELFGSTYTGTGDVVFEGNTLRLPQRYARTFSGATVWVRCIVMPETLDASTEPALQPYWLRPLIVYRALIMAAQAGGQRDPKPYQDLYTQAWRGVDGTTGFLATLTTQYARSHDGALEGVRWWRAMVREGGLVGAVGASDG